MNAPSPEPALTFQWPVEKGFSWPLFFCVTASLLAHAGTFVLFRVVYPQRVTIPQPAASVSLLAPNSAENIALLRWIEAEDPALIATAHSVNPPGLAQVAYRPSFAAPRTAPLGAPAETPQPVPFPAAVDRLRATELHPPAPAPPPAPARSRLSFSDTLSVRALTAAPELIAPPASSPVIPTVWLVGIEPDGEIRFQFLQQSSGDETLDEFAASHLRRLRFTPGESAIHWAHATFSWGGDVDPTALPPASK